MLAQIQTFKCLSGYVNKYQPDLVIEQRGERMFPISSEDLDIIDEHIGISQFGVTKRSYTYSVKPDFKCNFEKVNYLTRGQDLKFSINKHSPFRLYGWMIDTKKQRTTK